MHQTIPHSLNILLFCSIVQPTAVVLVVRDSQIKCGRAEHMRGWKQSSEFALRGLRDSTPNSLWCSLLRLLNFLLKHPAFLNLSLHVPLLLQLFPHADYTCDQPSALALGIKSQANEANLHLHSHSRSYSKVKRVQFSKCKVDDGRWGQRGAWTLQSEDD